MIKVVLASLSTYFLSLLVIQLLWPRQLSGIKGTFSGESGWNLMGITFCMGILCASLRKGDQG